MQLLLGARADPETVRAGGERAVIECLIKLDSKTRRKIMALMQREDLIDETDPDYLTLMREIRRRGRSTARINGISVRSELLAKIGRELFDIHGQSGHLSLFRPRQHIDLLDRYADLLDLRAGLGQLVIELTNAQSEMRAFREDR